MSSDKDNKFWDKIAARYAKRPIGDPNAYEEKLKVTRTYFEPNSEVLEVGCGTGSTAILHAPHVHHILATDISAKMLEIAQAKAEAEGISNITFKQAAIDEIDVADNSVDVVLGLSVLHLLQDKEAAIARIFRWLKPGGVFVSSTACIADSMKFFKYLVPIGMFLRQMPFVDVFTTEELVASLTNAGFSIDHQWTPGKGKAVFIAAKKSS